MAIINQKIDQLKDGKGGVKLTTTVDVRDALDAHELSKITGSIVDKGKSSEKRILFRIPQEMWTLDPVLRLAQLYKSAGDIAHYTAQIRKWMKENPKLCYEQERKFY